MNVRAKQVRSPPPVKLSSGADTPPAGRLEEHFDRWTRDDDERPRGIGAASAEIPPPVALDRNLTGDEAFQRRLAMSAGVKAPSPPRAPMPIPAPHPDIPRPPMSMSTFAPPAPPPVDAGDEAYLRRLAMSTPAPPPPPAIPSQPYVEPPRPPSPPTLAYNPFAPPSVPPPPPGPPGSMPNALEDRVKAAAAIAAKLGALAATAGSSSIAAPPEDDDKKSVIPACCPRSY